ncbi:MAG TPA: hypothetical protein DCY80_11815 [Solibacterales bacterium]|nr:hypothetical protein [Bryobacterales bacterium]
MGFEDADPGVRGDRTEKDVVARAKVAELDVPALQKVEALCMLGKVAEGAKGDGGIADVEEFAGDEGAPVIRIQAGGDAIGVEGEAGAIVFKGDPLLREALDEVDDGVGGDEVDRAGG